jgi:hypothetical protein
MSERRAEMMEMRPSGGHRLRLMFYAPTRGLIGYQGELLTDTRGTADGPRGRGHGLVVAVAGEPLATDEMPVVPDDVCPILRHP